MNSVSLTTNSISGGEETPPFVQGQVWIFCPSKLSLMVVEFQLSVQ